MRDTQKGLPKFTPEQKALVLGSLDFFSLNFYTAHFVKAPAPGAPKAQVRHSWGSRPGRRRRPAQRRPSLSQTKPWRIFFPLPPPSPPPRTHPPPQLYEEVLQDAKGDAPGPASDVFWLFDTPTALRSMLAWVSRRYSRPEVWVTENGVPAPDEAAKGLGEALKDTYRLDFFK
jgi:beta-glucosidase/6-phospho-beta-glucosidase/beta-galactosidase